MAARFRRSTMWRTALILVLPAVVCCSAFGPAISLAETRDVVFTINQAQSSFNYSATGGVYAPYQPTLPGSDTSSVSGHFLVRFDPLADTATSLQLLGGDGYYQQDSDLLYRAVSGVFAIKYSNLSWDFSSGVLSGSGGTFPATTTSFKVLSGALTEIFLQPPNATFDETGYTGQVTSGTWTLTQTAPGSGDWTLGISGYYVPSSGPQGASEKFTLNAVATAHFGTDNIATLAPNDTTADVLGGAATPGGVSINLPGGSNGGTFLAQQIPNSGGLSQQAIAAAENNPVFAASTAGLSATPQIWTVDYTGLQPGQAATLVFRYDPALLPAGTNEAELGIWHFNKNTKNWEFGGTVNAVDHTITFVTDNFSPFELGTHVPEPQTLLLAAMGLAAVVGYSRRLRRH
ncbi:MAG: PEP-CTERM sorting domain-containing protein [Planctomycetia bacterium]|nr:PEP-CTERM sorting domain-containing protein [Planctomycetia bacterium]